MEIARSSFMPNPAKRVQVTAHRGASGHAPETTMEAYRLALEMKADFVEMDIHMLRDGVLVAIHDPGVKRTTDGKGLICELTLAELKALDAGSWFNRTYPRKARQEYVGLKVPTLEEVIDFVKDSPAGCYIEIKDPHPPELESTLLSVIHNRQMGKRSRIISFSAQSIEKIKTMDSSIQTGLLISRYGKDPVRAAGEIRADELVLRYNLATDVIVDSAHGKGLTVSVWTVDRESDMERMIKLGVDCIVTNYPDRLQRLLV
jgi:glycerophosphoryl diester phosphodiesterase